MRMDMSRIKLGDIALWTIVVCVLLTTTLVVRRELSQAELQTAMLATATSEDESKYEVIYVDGWQEALAAGIRSGSADAPVQIVEFADFECPHCARFEATVQTIRDKYPDQVAFTFAHFPLSYHDSAESAARAAECAQLQGHFEAMRSLLFEKQQAFGEVPWTDFAKQAGVSDVKQFDACMNDTRSLERVEHSKKLGDELGVRGTPAIFVNGWKLPLAPSSEDLDKIVQNVAIGKPPTADVDLFADLARAND